MKYDYAARKGEEGGGRLVGPLASPGSAVGSAALSGCEVPQRGMTQWRSAFTAHTRLVAQYRIGLHAVAAAPPAVARELVAVCGSSRRGGSENILTWRRPVRVPLARVLSAIYMRFHSCG